MQLRLLIGLVAAVLANPAAADDRAEYLRRAANVDIAAFKHLDLNADGRVSRDEAKADLNFVPRFQDIDINRDGFITADEMSRYVRQRYGVEMS